MKKIFIVLSLIFIGFVLFQFINKSGTRNTSSFPQQYLDDRKNYTKAIQLFNDAMDLTKPPDASGKPFDMPKSQQQKILADLDGGISLSKQIDDGFLDYLDPDLKNHYRNQYTKGYELILQGLESDTSNKDSIGVKRQLEGNQLIGEWNRWWDSNKNQITNKAFPK